MTIKEPRPPIPKLKILSIGGFNNNAPDSKWLFDGSIDPKSVGNYFSKDWYLIGGYTVDELREIADNHFKGVNMKQPRYQDNTGDDWIDECAKTLTPEEFRGAMKFTIGKYLRRCGKKDSILQEVTKAADYCNRWVEYEAARSVTSIDVKV